MNDSHTTWTGDMPGHEADGPNPSEAPAVRTWAQLHPSGGDAWWPDLMRGSGHRLVAIGSASRRRPKTWHVRSGLADSILGKVSTLRRVGTGVAAPCDGILTHFPPLAVAAGIMLRASRSKMLVCHNFNVGHLPTGMSRGIAGRALRRADRVLVHARGEIETYARWFDLPMERFSFVPLHRPPFEEEEVDVPNEPYVYAAGSSHRDYPTLLKACRLTGLPTVVVAGWMHKETLSDAPENVEVRSGLTMRQCNRLLRCSAVNIVPLHDVPTAAGQVAVVSGLVAGVPTIATRCVGTIDYIDHGSTGLLYSPNEAGELAECMRQLWNDADLRGAMGGRARRFAEKSLSESAGAESLVAALNSVQPRR